ncbi:MAG TPA: carboxypeptidase-like regulatory domain-containing protein [Kiritimatiellia bacterium]|nr:carboxypeptidase-like regulatory domain-containing protein [Kiritimatiellia bacterium]
MINRFHSYTILFTGGIFLLCSYMAHAGSISGMVTRDTEEPVEGITVIAQRQEGLLIFLPIISHTDEYGIYQFTNLAGGTYSIQFIDETHRGFASVYYDQVTESFLATLIPLVAGTSVTGINAVMTPGVRISGTVTDWAGNDPLTNILVRAYRKLGDDDWSALYIAYTDADGKYNLRGMPSGTFRIKYSDPSSTYAYQFYDQVSSFEDATDIELESGQEVSDVDAILVSGSRIEGRITETDAATPISNAIVSVYAWNGSWWDTVSITESDSNGEYSAGGLPHSGEFRVGAQDYSGMYLTAYHVDAETVNNATSLFITNHVVLTNINLALMPAARIEGAIDLADSVPLTGFWKISLYRQIDFGLGSSWWIPAFTLFSPSVGTYSIGGITPGSYRVGVTHVDDTYYPSFHDGVDKVEDAVDIDFLPGETVADIDFIMRLRSPELLQPMHIIDLSDGTPVQWASKPGLFYAIDRTTNLQSGFIRIQSMIPATPPENSYMDESGITESPFFYRIVIENEP